ncbi:MAG: prepilin-type N-terminal cleavage/methylation domain-containing protein [Armatimonadota bacterium]
MGRRPGLIGLRERGFTLIELLVVIGILAVLAAIIYPTFARARGAARKAVCASNLRQLGMAVSMYADDWDGLSPRTTGWHRWGGDGTDGDEPGPGWEERLHPYVEDRRIYRCPAFPGSIEFSYFLNTRWFYANWWGKQIWFSALQRPAAYVLMGDCSAEELLPRPVGTAIRPWDSCDKDNMTYRCLLFEDTVHGNGSNVLFADGHVKFCTRYDPQTMTFAQNAMADWR